MSINVTVSGNPVRISRGKMVTCDPSKAEFEKRRLMRLEQVRQQSKNIAENIRNKLKKEKVKCLSEIEKDGEAKLKNWQARKLLELQNQYQEALGEIGLGHKEAARVEEEEEALIEQRDSNDKVAIERGRAAAEKLQIQKNEENLRKAVPIQRKKITRDVENARSSVIAKSQKKTKKHQVFDSDRENRVPELLGLEESDSDSDTGKKGTAVLKTSKEQQTSPVEFQVPTSDKAAQTVIVREESVKLSTIEVPMDTRISERIRRREKLNSEVDYCEFAEKDILKGTLCECCKCCIKPSQVGHPQTSKDHLVEENTEIEADLIPQKSDKKLPSVQKSDRNLGPDLTGVQKTDKLTDAHKSDRNLGPERTDVQRTDIFEKNPKQTSKTAPKTKSNIPPKPKVTLRSVKDRPAYIGVDPNAPPVQYYDHPNRFAKSYIPKTSLVDKIDDEELVISPNVLSEEEIREKMRQRDMEAHIRGQVALEKEKLQREYRELLKKLPVLQKQERICEIGMDKEKYHMSRDRLEELEKRRQNRLDNAYEELFVRKRPTVTLPRKKDEVEQHSLNLAAWDTDYDPDTSKSRTEQLTDLLSNLKSQKDSLLKEIENTLSKDTVNQLTNNKSSYEDVKSKSTDYTRSKTKRKRSREEGRISPTSTEPKSSKKGTATTISPSPRKKRKVKTAPKVIILQNTSTQTTPKTEQSTATSPLVNTPATEPESCTCKKDEEMCEIVIKIKEDEKPEVVVNPPFLGNVRVVTEKIDESEGKEGELKRKEKEEPKRKEREEPRRKDKEEPKRKEREEPKRKESEDPKRTEREESRRREIQEPKRKERKDESKRNGSWREQLSQTISSRSTSSTSYLDLPKRTALKKTPEVEEVSRSTVSSGGTTRQLDPRLLTYIKKLLSMSRASIDDLTVSAASDVSTPTPSVVETPSNNPLLQLRNVMKYFDIDAAELQKQLSYTSNESSKHYNTSESVTVNSSSEGEKSVQFKSCVDIDEKKEEPSKMLRQYADVTASCTKKISDLTAMIERVRAEKKKMLQSSTSSSDDKDLTTTSYKDLPEKKSPTQEELDKQLLNIDYNYAEKLKQLSQEEIQSEKKRTEHEPTDAQLLTRLKNLLQDSKTVTEVTQKILLQTPGDQPVALTSEKKIVGEISGGRTAGAATERTTVTLKPIEQEEPPIFLDIPKLPRLEAPSLDKKKKRPPPSKGLRAITGNTPHELSTIIEADSQVSTKVDGPSKTESSEKEKSQSSDDISEMETMETMLLSIGMDWAIPTLKKTREALALSSSSGSGEVSLRDFLSKISSSSSKSNGSLNESQGVSLIQVDNRRTSTPVGERKDSQPIFLTDSDISSVRDHSGRKDSEEKFYDLNEESLTKTGSNV